MQLELDELADHSPVRSTYTEMTLVTKPVS